MGNLFGTPDTGPSEEELRQRRIADSKKRAQALRSAALEESQTGVIQLFGPSNPAITNLTQPGGNNNNV